MKKTGKRRKIGLFVEVIGVLFLAAAISLTAFNLWDENRAEQAADAVLIGILDEMENEAAKAQAGADMPGGAPGAETVPELAGAGTTSYSIGWSDEAEMPTVVLDGENYLGILEIPSLELTLPVRDTWSYPNLRKTPCRYAGGLYSNDMVIAGHNYDSHFGRLEELQVGDEIFFMDMEKNRCAYHVLRIETLAAADVGPMTENRDWDLTLFTCTVNGRNRVTVRCAADDDAQDEI